MQYAQNDNQRRINIGDPWFQGVDNQVGTAWYHKFSSNQERGRFGLGAAAWPDVRVGEWGGHLLVDCDDPLAVHKFCSTYPAFEMEARPVIAVEDAVRVELEAIAWRDGLKRSLTSGKIALKPLPSA